MSITIRRGPIGRHFKIKLAQDRRTLNLYHAEDRMRSITTQGHTEEEDVKEVVEAFKHYFSIEPERHHSAHTSPETCPLCR